jgi:hypothetical protein
MAKESLPPTEPESDDSEERALGEIVVRLAADLRHFQKRMLSSAKRGTFTETDASYARALIRAFFALVEGTCNALKVQALGDMLDDEDRDIEPGLINIVFEERFEVDDNGRAAVKPLIYPLQKNIKFAFRIYSEASGHPNTLDTSASWWCALMEMSKLRDRFMHPKKPEDLDVTTHDVVRCAEAECGFTNAVLQLLEGPD